MRDTLTVIGEIADPPRERCRCPFCIKRRLEIALCKRLMVEMPLPLRREIRNGALVGRARG
jgi:hypothetical protein